MNRDVLRANLGTFFGEMTLSAESISAMSDMNELLALWTKSINPPDTKAIEARMMAVIKDLPVDNIDKLPLWFLAIVADEKLLPSKQLRDAFKEKAKEIYSRL